MRRQVVYTLLAVVPMLKIPAIDGHEDFMYIAGGGEAIGALSILGGLYVVNQSTKNSGN